MFDRAEEIRTVAGLSGDRLTVRSADLSDVTAIADLYGRLSTSSFASRFMSCRSNGSLLPLARFDPDRGDVVLLAALAGAPQIPIAEARYVPTGEDVAEFAILVEDRAQGHGVGRLLLAELLRVAEQRGLARLSARVLANNDNMLGLVYRLGWALVGEFEYETVSIEVSTCGGMPGWPNDGRRRILVEGLGFHDAVAISRLRASGTALRRCVGPRQTPVEGSTSVGNRCPLVASGQCRLAEGADEIIALLPEGVAAYDEILAEHRRRWPERLRQLGAVALIHPEVS